MKPLCVSYVQSVLANMGSSLKHSYEVYNMATRVIAKSKLKKVLECTR